MAFNTVSSANVGGDTPVTDINLGTTGIMFKSAAGQLHSYYISNRSAGELFVKLYDKATAATSADTPKWVLPLPAGQSGHLTGLELQFAAGICARATTGVAHNDNTAPGANECIVNFGVK